MALDVDVEVEVFVIAVETGKVEAVAAEVADVVSATGGGGTGRTAGVVSAADGDRGGGGSSRDCTFDLAEAGSGAPNFIATKPVTPTINPMRTKNMKFEFAGGSAP